MAGADMELATWTKIFMDEAGDFLRGHDWHLEFDGSIEAKHLSGEWKEYIRNTSARFRCSQCGRSWPSNQVKVVFRMILQETTGTVKVRVYRQNCKNCDSAPMEAAVIGPDNIRTLMRNLVKKIRIKCYQEYFEQEDYTYNWIDGKNPHEPEHCEGCLSGICKE